jgi:hypothetical protein
MSFSLRRTRPDSTVMPMPDLRRVLAGDCEPPPEPSLPLMAGT